MSIKGINIYTIARLKKVGHLKPVGISRAGFWEVINGERWKQCQQF